MKVYSYFYYLFLYFIFSNKYIHCEEISKNSIRIPIAYNIDVKEIYPVITSMTSIMENSDKLSHIIFYFLSNINSDNHDLSKKIFDNFCENYNNKYCEIKYIDFSGLKEKYNINIMNFNSTFYYLFLADYLPEEEKIIYLHGDTIILEDLKEMINLETEKNYYLGFLDFDIKGVEYLGINTENFINEGVTLINLKLIREKKIIISYVNFIKEKFDILKNSSQNVLNAVNYLNIGILPPRFGWLCRNLNQMKSLYKKTKNKFSEEEYDDAYGEPVILHYCGEPKPWNDGSRDKSLEWWYFANKTTVKNEIIEKYGIPKVKIKTTIGLIRNISVSSVVTASILIVVLFIISKFRKS